MSLSVQTSLWAGAVVADSKGALTSAASAKTIRQVLSTAGSRGPQRTLGPLVVPHVSVMLKSEPGCDILATLLTFGTKKVAADVIVAVGPLISVASLSRPQAQVLGSLLSRRGCTDASEEVAKKLSAAVLRSPAEVPHLLVVLPPLLAADPAVLAKKTTSSAIAGALKATSGSHDAIAFAVESVRAAQRVLEGDAAAAFLVSVWQLLDEAGRITPATALPLCKSGCAPLVSSLLAHLKKNKLAKAAAADPRWGATLAAAVRCGDDEAALEVAQLVVGGGAASGAALAAVESRFPDMILQVPKLAAAATSWSRAHQPGFQHTRALVAGRVKAAAAKRPREDEF